MYSSTTKQEALRLRVEEQRSLKEIAQYLGISKATASVWLREFPLPEAELKKRAKRTHGGAPKKDRGQQSKLHRMASDSGIEHTHLQKGKISGAAVLLRMAIHGFEVYASMFDGDQFDWVIRCPGTKDLKKVQVKSAKGMKEGLPTIDLSCSKAARTRRRYKEGEFDFIIGYDLFTDTCYVWSWDEVSHLKSSVTICPEAAERWDKMCP